ncbi:MAG: hypothetical protein LPK07_15020 [Hymenobacteraceae bacterium]|nr:hypothetical protein [Hymenobacteraceae bacterium]MDX5482988.1 hypothetical protein [Hymenobacteraceae bacterium]
MRLPFLTVSLLSILLLFTRCEPLTDALPTPAKASDLNRTGTSTLRITTVDGATAVVECTVEVRPSGEIIQLCMPEQWNGELILYAHGYVPAFLPLSLPTQADTYRAVFTSAGYAFATTSFRENGIAILSGIEDMINLRRTFMERHPGVREVYLAGASQGGIITTLAAERYPELFSGGLALCGPCGYFQGQINYYGSFRVLFDYFFPGVLPGNAVDIPEELIRNWETKYIPLVLSAIGQNPGATLKLLRTAKAPYDPNDPATIQRTVIDVLTYNVLYTADARVKLGGQPFDNEKYVYFGTGSIREDARLNLNVQRFSADKAALQHIQNNYETTGELAIPLVNGHTTKDPIQLFWHLPLYKAKTVVQGNNENYTGIAVPRYGHCTFTDREIVAGFALLVQQVKGLQEPLLARVSDAEGRIVREVTVN